MVLLMFYSGHPASIILTVIVNAINNGALIRFWAVTLRYFQLELSCRQLKPVY